MPNATTTLLAMADRETYLRDHERPGPGLFNRDFIAAFSNELLNELDRFDDSGVMDVRFGKLFHRVATAAERQRLCRAFKSLRTDGQVEFVDQMFARITPAGRATLGPVKAEGA